MDAAAGSGETIADRFVVETGTEKLGGIGAVHRARDLRTGETVAIKRLRQPNGADLPRFLREAELLSQLDHPGIVRHVAHGLTDDGTPYLVMEWLVGEPLNDRLARGVLTLEETLTMGRRIAEALGFAHARGFIHRDVKPANVFLEDGKVARAKLIDLGVARADLIAHELTDQGTMVGTLGYMAPEQARADEDVDARADVFALGCVLYKCLAGAAPFVGDNLTAVLAKTLFEEPPRLRELVPNLPRPVDWLIQRMLAKEPSRRPSDGEAVVTEIDALATANVGRVSTTPPSNARTGITEGEQSLVSVVLATAPAARREEDTLPIASMRGDVRAADTVLESLRTELGPLGARVDTLANGLVVATLSGAVSATDQAAQAARCAFAMAARLGSEHVALATGRGVLGSRLPVGVAIDRAVRLLKERRRAEPGDPLREAPVLLDEVTAGLLDGRFEAKALRRSIFALSNERETPEVVRTLLGRPTPFVGRARELSVLTAIFEACVEDPSAQCALVTGAAGVGKSRLRYEMLRALRQKERGPRSSSVEIWIARGAPLGERSPLRLLGHAMRSGLRILDGEPIAATRTRLRTRVARSVPEPDVQRVAEFLGELVGVPFPDDPSVQLRAARKDPVLRGDQMRRAAEDFLVAECSLRPLVLVLEDLHWGDAASLELIDRALKRLREKPFFVLALARPEAHDRFPTLFAGAPLTHIELTELTPRASERLIRDVLGLKVDDATVHRIVQRADGNAFFLEELIRAVAERPDATSFPETVLAMAQARLEGVSPEGRRALRAASVFGDIFHAGAVTHVLGGEASPAKTKQALEDLGTLELVTHRPHSRIPGETEYVFRHAYVREAAYSTFTETDRALAHRLAAEWLEKSGERDAFAVAEHWERAAAPERATHWYQRSAEQALEADDLGLALERAQRGARTGSGDIVGELRLLQAEAHAWRGEYADTLGRAEEAMVLLPPDSDGWCEAAGHAAEASGRLGRHERLAELGERLAPLAAVERPRVLVACVRAAAQLFFAGQFERGHVLVTATERARGALAVKEPAATAWIDYGRSVRALFAGDLGDHVRLKELVVEGFERAGDRRNACIQRVRLGYGWITIGAHGEGERVLREALRDAERMRLGKVSALAKHNLGLALARLGRLDEARAMEKDALEAFEGQGDRRLAGASHLYLAWIWMAGGNTASAELHARAAVATQENSPPSFAEALATLASVLLAAGRTSEAIEAAIRARELLDTLGGVEDAESMIRLVHVMCLRASGQSAQAAEALEVARRRILTRADRIRDPSMRRMFVEEEPDNRRTLTLADEGK